MSDTHENATDSAGAPVSGPGRRLREAREGQGIATADVASELRLSEKLVRALEADDYAALPPASYVRGYLRSYGRLLGIDAKELIAAYDASSEQATEADLVIPEQGADRVSFSPRLALVLLVLLAAAGAAAWWYWGDPPLALTDATEVVGDMGGETVDGTVDEPVNGLTTDDAATDDRATDDPAADDPGDEIVDADVARAMDDHAGAAEGGEEPSDDAVERATDTDAGAEPLAPATIDDPGTAADDDEAPVGQPAIVDPELATPDVEPDPDTLAEHDARIEALFERIPPDMPITPSEDADDTEDRDAATEVADAADEGEAAEHVAPETPGAGPDMLVLTIDGESWIEVHDDREQRLVYTLYSGQERLEIRGWAPFEVFLGNAPAVDVSFDGETVDTGPFVRANDTARFVVNGEGARSP